MMLSTAAIQLLADLVKAGSYQGLAKLHTLTEEQVYDSLIELDSTAPGIWLDIDHSHQQIEPTPKAMAVIAKLQQPLSELLHLTDSHKN